MATGDVQGSIAVFIPIENIDKKLSFWVACRVSSLSNPHTKSHDQSPEWILFIIMDVEQPAHFVILK